MQYATLHHENGYDLLLTDVSYVLAFKDKPEIIEEKITLKGAILSAGDDVLELSGKYKSGVYESLHTDGIKYIGTYTDVEKVHKYVLFLDSANPQPASMSKNDWNYMYYAFVYLEGDLFFCNVSGSARILQTENVVKI